MNTSERSLRSLPKSSPIAIKRSHSGRLEQQRPQLPLDSDDDSSSTTSIEESMDRLTVGSLPTKQRGFAKKTTTTKLAKSMPAPRLTPQKRETYDLPPMSLPEADAPDNDVEGGGNRGTYGSLRDSHMKGRFMDGPMSYRDARSGQIHWMQSRGTTLAQQEQHQHPHHLASSLPHRYTSQQNMPLSSSMADWSRMAPGISSLGPSSTTTASSSKTDSKQATSGRMMPGDRMRSSPKLQAQPSSKLADALECGNPQKATKDNTAEFEQTSSPEHFALYPAHCTDHNQQTTTHPLSPDAVLSTSLTGLELLQKVNARGGGGGGLLTPSTAVETPPSHSPTPTSLLLPHHHQQHQHHHNRPFADAMDDEASNDQDAGGCFDLDL